MPDLSPALPIIGTIHLLPLPGAPRGGRPMQQVFDQARDDALWYRRAGVDALLVENHGDAPFPGGESAPHVPAILAVIARALREEFRSPVGINVLRNDVRGALGAAAAAGASFVRANVLAGTVATDQGLIEGQADRVLLYRRALGIPTEIWADVDVKFGTSLYRAPLEVQVAGLFARSGADRVLVTGVSTGAAPSLDDLRRTRLGAGNRPILIASGLTADNVAELLPLANGAIVGSAFKADGEVGNPVDPQRVTWFMNRVRSVRQKAGFPA